MLNWKDLAKKDMRRSASVVVSELALSKQHAIRVAAIPGAMESIASLLQTSGGSADGRPYEAAVVVDEEDYEFSDFNLLGLLILKRLASDQDNCCKIGNTKGLLVHIINLTSRSAMQLLYGGQRHGPPSQWLDIDIVKSALEVIKSLARARGQTGNTLRKDISENMYLMTNIKKLLKDHEGYWRNQLLGLEILTSLAMNEEAREKIGATWCMLRLLISVFFQEQPTVQMHEAGEALVMLILESKSNCDRMLKERDAVGRLLDALNKQDRQVKAARILRGLCAYSAPQQSDRLQIVAKAMPMVLKTIVDAWMWQGEILEVSIGLAVQMLKYINAQDFENEIERAGIEVENFVKKLVKILHISKKPKKKVPKMRRFVIELAIALMKYEGKYIELFRNFGMEQVLIRTAETTSELECFNIISESEGLSRHEVTISSLVDTALELLEEGSYDGWKNSMANFV